MIFTSYYGQLRNLAKSGITPIAISRSVPAGFAGRRIMELTPTWAMLKMSDADYDRCFEEMLTKVDRDALVKSFDGQNVALMCWEKDINDCHRKRVGEWLREGGYEVEEFGVKKETAPVKKEEPKDDPVIQRQVSIFELLSMM